MTTYTCPDGHASSTGDYCDVCGMPIPIASGAAGGGGGAGVEGGASTAPAAASGGAAAAPAYGSSLDLDAPTPPPPALPGAPPAATDQMCPHCGAANLPDALYCEDCGYDFTTGQLPRPLAPPTGMPTADAPPVLAPPDTGSVPITGSGPIVAPSGAPSASSAPPASFGSAADAGAVLAPPVTPTSAPGHVEWVAEVWVDPDWYAAQDVSDPCPSAGMPWVVPILERSVLIGRTSTTRNIHPQIDISTDSGVSRRHAQLSSDGQRWWVEDLQSANGTYVGAPGAPLPTTPIQAGQRVELAEDERIYLGAWSRVVVRRATPEESTLGS